MFKSGLTRKTVLSLAYPYGLSRQPLPQRVTYQHSSATGEASGQDQTTRTDQQPPQQQKQAWRIRVPEERCHTGRREFQLSSCMDVLVPPLCDPWGSQQEAREAAEYRGTSAFGEQRGRLMQARRAPHKGRPRKVRNVLADPCQVPLPG